LTSKNTEYKGYKGYNPPSAVLRARTSNKENPKMQYPLTEKIGHPDLLVGRQNDFR